jgi:hypothetical protein
MAVPQKFYTPARRAAYLQRLRAQNGIACSTTAFGAGHAAHGSEVRSLYRRLLRNGARFPDAVSAAYVQWRSRTLFRRRASPAPAVGDAASQTKVLGHLLEAHSSLRTVERARLRHDRRSMRRVVELAFGARGRVKHVIAALIRAADSDPRREASGRQRDADPALVANPKPRSRAAVEGRLPALTQALVRRSLAEDGPKYPRGLLERLHADVAGTQDARVRRAYSDIIGFVPDDVRWITAADVAPVPPKRGDG